MRITWVGVLFVGLVVTAAIGGRNASLASAARDRDCSDFTSQAAAQRFFVAHGGTSTNDFDNLDGDGDGVACESLPCPCSGSDDAGDGATPVPAGDRLAATIVRDIDGDTVVARFANGAVADVRLIGVDTPEEYRPGTPVECGALAAARSMRELAAHRPATLVTDPTQSRFDRYGRLLAYLYVGARDLDRVQIRRGWGYTYIYENNPFQHVVSFRSAEAAARSEARGVWGRCNGNFHSAGG